MKGQDQAINLDKHERQPLLAPLPLPKIEKIKKKFKDGFPRTDIATKKAVAKSAYRTEATLAGLTLTGGVVTASYFYENSFKLADLILTQHPKLNTGFQRVLVMAVVAYGNTIFGVPVNAFFNGASYLEEGEVVVLGWGGKTWKRLDKKSRLKALRSFSAIALNLGLATAAFQGFYLVAQESIGDSIWFWPTNISNAIVAAAGISEVQQLIEEMVLSLRDMYYKPRISTLGDLEAGVDPLHLWVRTETSHLLDQLGTLSNVETWFKGWLSQANPRQINAMYALFKQGDFATQKNIDRGDILKHIFTDTVKLTQGQQLVPLRNRIVATLSLTLCALNATFGYVLLMVHSVIYGDISTALKILRLIGVVGDAGIVLVFVAQYINSLRKINAFLLAGNTRYNTFHSWVAAALSFSSWFTFGATGYAVFTGALKLWGGCNDELTECYSTIAADVLLLITAVVTRYINKQASTNLAQSLSQKAGLANGNDELFLSLQFVKFVDNLKVTLTRIIKHYKELSPEQCKTIIKEIAELIPDETTKETFIKEAIGQHVRPQQAEIPVNHAKIREHLVNAQAEDSTPIQQAAKPKPPRNLAVEGRCVIL